MRAIFLFAAAAISNACLPNFDLDTLSFPGDAMTTPTDADPPDAPASPDIPASPDVPDPPDNGVEDIGVVLDGGVPERGTLLCHDGVDNDLDNKIDCVDIEDCGLDACNDQNDCTDESCLSPSGMCSRMNNTREEGGWRCVNGDKHETRCLLTSGDEDEDGNANCRDLDCCEDVECLTMTCP
jgi:hypothetical protein